MPITYHDVIARLEENGLRYATLELDNMAQAILLERGARVLGPFLEPDGESLFWINEAFADPAAFRDLLARNHWNTGGDRFWIAPEFQYSVQDRADFWHSYCLQPAMDPANYTLERVDLGTFRWRTRMSLNAYNPERGVKDLDFEISIQPADDPLRRLKGYNKARGVTYTGYQQTTTLTDSSPDDIPSETWNILELHKGGVLVVPCSPKMQLTDYMEPIDKSQYRQGPGFTGFQITGDRRYKVGINAAHVTGRMGYLFALEDGRNILIVRNFFNNPSAPYIEEPADRPGKHGDSVHIYNDSGENGGYGEMECHGQAIGGRTGRASSTDAFQLWIYAGPEPAIREVTRHLLGV